MAEEQAQRYSFGGCLYNWRCPYLGTCPSASGVYEIVFLSARERQERLNHPVRAEFEPKPLSWVHGPVAGREPIIFLPDPAGRNTSEACSYRLSAIVLPFQCGDCAHHSGTGRRQTFAVSSRTVNPLIWPTPKPGTLVEWFPLLCFQYSPPDRQELYLRAWNRPVAWWLNAVPGRDGTAGFYDAVVRHGREGAWEKYPSGIVRLVDTPRIAYGPRSPEQDGFIDKYRPLSTSIGVDMGRKRPDQIRFFCEGRPAEKEPPLVLLRWPPARGRTALPKRWREIKPRLGEPEDEIQEALLALVRLLTPPDSISPQPPVDLSVPLRPRIMRAVSDYMNTERPYLFEHRYKCKNCIGQHCPRCFGAGTYSRWERVLNYKTSRPRPELDNRDEIDQNEEDLSDLEDQPPGLNQPGTMPNPEQALVAPEWESARIEASRRLKTAINKLTIMQATIIRSIYWDDEKPGPIAERLGVDPRTVTAHHDQALDTLRLAVGDDADPRAWIRALRSVPIYRAPNRPCSLPHAEITLESRTFLITPDSAAGKKFTDYEAFYCAVQYGHWMLPVYHALENGRLIVPVAGMPGALLLMADPKRSGEMAMRSIVSDRGLVSDKGWPSAKWKLENRLENQEHRDGWLRCPPFLLDEPSRWRVGVDPDVVDKPKPQACIEHSILGSGTVCKANGTRADRIAIRFARDVQRWPLLRVLISVFTADRAMSQAIRKCPCPPRRFGLDCLHLLINGKPLARIMPNGPVREHYDPFAPVHHGSWYTQEHGDRRGPWAVLSASLGWDPEKAEADEVDE